MSHLGADPRQSYKVIIVVRDLPSVLVMNDLSGLLNVDSLLVVEADLRDPFVQIGLIRLEDRLY